MTPRGMRKRYPNGLMAGIYRFSLFAWSVTILGCSVPKPLFASDIEYRRVIMATNECHACEALDLSAFNHFGAEALVEEAVAYRIHRSEILSTRIWVGDRDGEEVRCARALLTEAGALRARQFATASDSDPLEDALAVFINGHVLDIVLRGTLRAGPALGCFESAEEARRALSPLGSIPTKDQE